MEAKVMLEVYKAMRGDVLFRGESYSDREAVKNLKEQHIFIYALLEDLYKLNDETRDRYEMSANSINAEVIKMLKDFKEVIDDALES